MSRQNLPHGKITSFGKDVHDRRPVLGGGRPSSSPVVAHLRPKTVGKDQNGCILGLKGTSPRSGAADTADGKV